jgi:hypothetical protein
MYYLSLMSHTAGIGEVCHPGAGERSALRKKKTSGELECTQRWKTSQYRVSGNTGHRSLASLNSQCHVITNKYPEAGTVVQQVHKVLNDIEILAGCTPAKVGESSQWTSLVNSEDNRANFCKGLDGKTPFSALLLHVHGNTECKGRKKWRSEQNLIGLNSPG